MEKKRIGRFDNLKGLLVIVVVFIHVMLLVINGSSGIPAFHSYHDSCTLFLVKQAICDQHISESYGCCHRMFGKE